ncbi:hypothetical protein ALC53_12619 [Atta colombica]|uniref:Uncharacterized protein n=1 Tax=Atta colombica TaxID=520822 RepID=A0A151HZ93_9HYME|nr:hypothetical protein ALC53_12619 [Atta colombica]
MWITLSRGGFWREIVLERVQDAIERHRAGCHIKVVSREIIMKRAMIDMLSYTYQQYVIFNIRNTTYDVRDNTLSLYRFISLYSVSKSNGRRIATWCHIASNDMRVHDRCHLTGKYCSPAHDGHVDVLSITKEKYIIKLRSIDSFKFLNTSFDKLVSFLSRDKLKIRSKFSTLSDEEFELTRKGVFPYEWVMCQPLPNAEFRWVANAVNFDVRAIAPDSPINSIYVIHRNLQQCQYIDLNTQFRTCAKNDFEKNLFKLMNNEIFGMENVRKHINAKLLTKWNGTETMITKSNFHSCSIFVKNFIAVELHKLEVKFNKPRVGTSRSLLLLPLISLPPFSHV